MTKPITPQFTPTFFEPAQAGKTLKEVGIDYLKVESKNITSRWFHSAHDVDLFLWLDEHSQVIKQQVSFCGQIVEWNVLDGIKTGFVIEEEFGHAENSLNKVGQSETIRFDSRPQEQAIHLAVEVIKSVEKLEDVIRSNMLTNFGLNGSSARVTRIKKSTNVTPVALWQRIFRFFKS